METLRAQEASSSTSRCSYHVFLSFRGTDTRKTFTDHLYTALVQAGFRTFRDDEGLERGKHVKSELNRAIQQSRLSIIVFSKDYASSKWCLDELLMIHECMKIYGHLVVPVFYHVEPSDVRYQTGSIKEAFDRYEEKLMAKNDDDDDESKKEWMDRVNGWRAALKEVADLSGMVLQNVADGHESKFIQKIIKIVTAKVNRPALKIPQFPVGLHSRTKSINRWLNDGSTDTLVIFGMGGVGKTTIAKIVYNLNHPIFERSCFLANINQSNDLLTLQKQLLSNILKGQKEMIYDVDEGTVKIEEAIRCNKVFIVLDDVDDVKQLDILIGTQDFCPGSKIIITTRNECLLRARKIHKLHQVGLLDDDESLKLFSWHAFRQDHPLKEYSDEAVRVVQRCGGLPLALEVLGCSLTGKSINVWKSALQKLEAILNSDILKILKISYDLLKDEHDRNLFLDIACFFVGEDKSYIVTILDKCGYFTEDGMQNLIEKSLLVTSPGNLEMHQLIQKMGREIVRQESTKDPGKRSRLWHHEDSFNVMKGNEGTESIEGLALDLDDSVKSSFSSNYPNSLGINKVTSLVKPYFSFLSRPLDHTASRDSSGVELSIKAFERMKRLRLLRLKHVQFTGSYEHFPRNLAWLSWHEFPLYYIPTDLPLPNLVALDLRYSMLEQVWDRTMDLPSLQILDLSHSRRLGKIVNFFGIRNLERLILKSCVSLVDICESICNLERLVELDLEGCKKLEKLPRNIQLLGSLETLVMSGCSNLGTIMNTSLSSSLSWSGLFKPKRNPEIINLSLPRSLVKLDLTNCNIFENSFPKDLSQLSLLRKLFLDENPIEALPESIETIPNLEYLSVNKCNRLRSMIGLPCSVRYLFAEDIESMERITFKSKPQLLRYLDGNENPIEALPESIETLPNLEYLSVNKCNRLRSMIGLPCSLRYLFTQDIESMERITFKSKPQLLRYALGFTRLREMQGFFRFEPIGAVDSDLINDLGLINVESLGDLEVLLYYTFPFSEKIRWPLQGLHEFGIFSTYIPVSKVPGWFNDENRRLSSSFTVPSHPNNLRIRGLNVCVVHGKHFSDWQLNVYPAITKIHNKTKNLTWIYQPVYFGIGVYRDGEDFVWLSHWKFGNQLESGDEVTVTVFLGGELIQVEKIGINLVYGDIEDNVSENIDEIESDEVVGGDLTKYQLSTGAYCLAHGNRINYLNYDFTRRVVFGDNVKFEELDNWTWTGRYILSETEYSNYGTEHMDDDDDDDKEKEEEEQKKQRTS